MQQLGELMQHDIAAGRAEIDGGLALGDGLGIGGAAVVAALAALGLRQEGFDLAGGGHSGVAVGFGYGLIAVYSELTKTSTALARLAVTCVLSAARRLVLIFVNPL